MINEVYASIQGEGVRVGTVNVFVRFTGCNMRCEVKSGEKSPGGFDCDTEFESGNHRTIEQLLSDMAEASDARWAILTGGEPGLQIDRHLIDALHDDNWKVAIETNGSVELPNGVDWITVSPKVAEHCIRQTTANEVKYVRGYGQAIPKTRVKAKHKLISPAFNGLEIDRKSLEWCKQLVMENPDWRLSTQIHKWINAR